MTDMKNVRLEDGMLWVVQEDNNPLTFIGVYTSKSKARAHVLRLDKELWGPVSIIGLFPDSSFTGEGGKNDNLTLHLETFRPTGT